MGTAAYIRVSTDEQDPQRQRNEISDQYDVDEWYQDIESGAVFTGRQDFDRLRSEMDQWDEVVFHEVSRLGRSARETDEVMREFRDTGVTVHFLNPMPLSLYPDPEMAEHRWEAMFNEVIFDFAKHWAEAEREQIRQRTKSALRRLEQEGKWSGGRVPAGYRVDEDGYLVEDADEYERIRRMCQRIMEGRPKRRVAAFYGLESGYESILSRVEDSEKPYYEDIHFDDDQWQLEQAKVKAGKKELDPLTQEQEVVDA